jgi:hypothetical protein
MPETWLRTNVRWYWVASFVPVLLAPAGVAIGCGLFGLAEQVLLRGLGWLIAVGFASVAAILAVAARRPRLACAGQVLLVFLRRGRPVQVPLDVVEGFLLGHGPSFLPGERHVNTEVKTVVIRLAEHAAEWAQVEVAPELGSWCGHYVTIRGTWSEPLSIALVNRLNERLAESKRNIRQGRNRQSQDER